MDKITIYIGKLKLDFDVTQETVDDFTAFVGYNKETELITQASNKQYLRDSIYNILQTSLYIDKTYSK